MFLYSALNRSVIRPCYPASRKRQSPSPETHHEGHCGATDQSSVQCQDSKHSKYIKIYKLQKNLSRYLALHIIPCIVVLYRFAGSLKLFLIDWRLFQTFLFVFLFILLKKSQKRKLKRWNELLVFYNHNLKLIILLLNLYNICKIYVCPGARDYISIRLTLNLIVEM